MHWVDKFSPFVLIDYFVILIN